jgi:hypothetical protein
LLATEIGFIEQYIWALQSGDNPKRTFPGIVPYSSKRETVWEWRHLYLEKIVPIIKSNHQQAVDECFQRRSTNKVITQHYFGVVLTGNES